ncbi:MAG TPA: ATP-binding protein [Thermohalobaculum sp.]|nr:ATP-binding protein [Thermohalobaculum sp.]
MPHRVEQRASIERQAMRAFAEARLRQQWQRVLFFLSVLALALVYVPAAWAAGCVVALLAGELLERRAAGGFVAAPDEGFRAAWRGLVVANLVTASASGLVIVVLWVFAAPDERLYPLGVLFISTFYAALAYPQVTWLLMARQGLSAGLAAALALRDMMLGGALTVPGLVTGLLPVLAFAVYVVGLSRWSARTYRRQLEYTHALAAARDTAERARAAKARLIATISHELRTPLNGIIGMAQTLLAGSLADGARRQVAVIAESGRNLNALLNDILDFSKLEAGQLSIAPAEDDLRRAVAHVEELYHPVAAQKGIAFDVGVDPQVPHRLVFDAVRVRQCLANLVANAIKFTDAGAVRLAVFAEPDAAGPDGAGRWRISAVVSDTGIGIPPDHQRRLFAPFTQADGGIARRYGGTGLGLSITRHLAEAMGGDVTVESRPGEGSTFRLGFLAGAVAGAGTGDAGARPEPDLAGRRVLVADDAATSRMVLRLFLQPLGVEVFEAADGRAALEALGRGHFDAAFIDLNMPGMSGAELAERIRSGDAGRTGNPGRPRLPLVAVTGVSGDEADEAGHCAGFDAHLLKPIDPAAVRATLAAVLAKAQDAGAGSAAPERGVALPG